MHADLCTLDCTKLTCDILTLGLLCQAFSQASILKGFAAPMLSEVYRRTKRPLREIQARVVIIECARQFLAQDGGKDAGQVRELLMQCGYQRGRFDASNRNEAVKAAERDRVFRG
jgi:site-specific DNA-cytosine methylase